MLGRSVLVLFPTSEEASFALDGIEDLPPVIETHSVGGGTELRRAILEEPTTHVWIEVFFATCAKQGKEIKSVAKRLIEDIQPHLVIIPGIAGGARNGDYGICDVIISDELMYVLRKKSTEDGQKYRTRIVKGDFGEAISQTNISAKLAVKLRVAAGRSVRAPTKKELVDAARNAGVEAELPKTLAEARAHFARVIARGPRVGASSVIFSEYTNEQKRDAPLTDLRRSELELHANEMEATYVCEAMQELGRKDAPLVIKAISDIPGFLRSEKIKNIARSVAALALRGFLEEPEVWHLIKLLPSRPRFIRVASPSYSSNI